jgi:hypothetical protein
MAASASHVSTAASSADMEGPAVKCFVGGVVDLSIDIDIREILVMMRTTSRGRRRWGDDGTASTTNQADMHGLPATAEPHDMGSSGAASV